ncbi:Phosphotransferase enzyme family protein [Rubripirellula lacrimiformis]|uniref:Phosphotransferase enzyme family protein n=1 Tax=Rubripirellula lacrimiformis TaxID=1930273 RepID=A0A517NA66_9BACT|nr:aminoglycoside phosphotransferase family protein [Rubripirellula lacrimiformis]QDT04029.1 Phosphotransferase enzyme family protein [Rubripirellula lacrimiformis]
MDCQLPTPIRTEWLATRAIERVTHIAPGFSGASVYRCQSSDGTQWALKHWPIENSPSRVAEVHQVQQAARDGGIESVPKIEASMTVAGRIWELSTWMTGDPATGNAAPATVQAGAELIRQFHQAVSVLGSMEQPAPAIQNRIQRLNQLRHELPAALRDAGVAITAMPVPVGESIGRACRELAQHWNSVAAEMDAQLTAFARTPVPTQFVLRDVHREHILFSNLNANANPVPALSPSPPGLVLASQLAAGTQVPVPTGLIDFDAVRVDTPIADLARWVGSFLASRNRTEERELWQAALADWGRKDVLQQRIVWGDSATQVTDHSPNWLGMGLNPQDALPLAQTLHFATTWISLANWVIWCVSQKRVFLAGPDQIAGRIDDWTTLAVRDRMFPQT